MIYTCGDSLSHRSCSPYVEQAALCRHRGKWQGLEICSEYCRPYKHPTSWSLKPDVTKVTTHYFKQIVIKCYHLCTGVTKFKDCTGGIQMLKVWTRGEYVTKFDHLWPDRSPQVHRGHWPLVLILRILVLLCLTRSSYFYFHAGDGRAIVGVHSEHNNHYE